MTMIALMTTKKNAMMMMMMMMIMTTFITTVKMKRIKGKSSNVVIMLIKVVRVDHVTMF